MRAPAPALLLIAAFAASSALAQVAPQGEAPQGAQAPAAPSPAPSGPAPAPPPVVLLPPASDTGSDAPAAKPKEAPKPVRRTSAVIQALDKTTAETLRFEAPVGQPIRYKDLIFIVHACEDSALELGQHGAAAHVEIQSSPRPIAGRATPSTRQLFRGWIFANAPGLHPFEHPVYDVWLIGCRGQAAPALAPAG